METRRLLLGFAASCAMAFPMAAPAQKIEGGRNSLPKIHQKVGKARLFKKAPVRAYPIRIARVRADGSMAEPWRPVIGLDWPNEPWFMAFDCFEADPASANGTPYDGSYGVNYNDPGMGGSRYYFGPTFQNMFCANDMTSKSGYAAGRAERTSFAWYWNGQPGERCIVIIQTFDRFGDTDAGVGENTSVDQFLGGYALDFGTELTPDDSFFAGVNLTAPDFFPLPADGKGAYTMTIVNQLDPGPPPTATLASIAQPMLWFTKPLNPSFQGPLQWDDDNPADFVHRTNPPGPVEEVELYDYTDSVPGIPVPLGAMVAFYSHAEVVNPTSYLVNPGLDLGGGLASLLLSDDVTLHTKVNLASEEVGHQIQVILSTVSPIAVPTSLEFVLEDQVNITTVQRLVKLWNYQTSQWEELDASLIGAAVNHEAFAATGDLSRFVQAGTRNVRAMVGYDLISADLFFAWEAFIDLAVFRVGHPET